MAQLLRALTAHPEDLSSVPGTYTKHLTATRNVSSWMSEVSVHSQAAAGTCTLCGQGAVGPAAREGSKPVQTPEISS